MVSSSASRQLGFRRDLRRPEESERADRVTFIELFLDLIFVLALTQLSSHLYDNQTLTGAAESAVLVLAVWWVWIYTTWVTNWLDPSKLPVRAAVIVLALIGLVMGTSIVDAFGERGLVFAIAYSSLQLGRTVFMIAALARHDPALRGSFVRILVWLGASSVLWIVGAVVPLDLRLPFWVAALGLEYLSAGIGFRVPGVGVDRVENWDLSGEHIAERSALFVIIALGESFLVTGFAFVDLDIGTAAVGGTLSAFVAAVAMWWLYFDRGERAGAEAIAASSTPGRIARLAYTYVHAIIIAGIVLTSVADKEVLKHPLDPMIVSTAITIVGGPLLYLVGLILFRRVIDGTLLVSHLSGLVAMLVALGFSTLLSPLALGISVTTILVIVAVWETRRRLTSAGPVEDSADEVD